MIRGKLVYWLTHLAATQMSWVRYSVGAWKKEISISLLVIARASEGTLTLSLLVANLVNMKLCQKAEK